MPLYKTKAITLRNFNLSETDKLVTFYTEEFGKVKCVAKAARKIKNRFGSALEPMSLINIIYFGKENQNLYRLNQCDIIESFQDVRESQASLYFGIYFNELVDTMVREEDSNKPLFNLLHKALQSLQSQNSFTLLCRLFELRILACLGYTPILDHCALCKSQSATGWMNLSFSRSGIVCAECSSKTPVDIKFSIGTLNYIRKLATRDFTKLDRLKIPKNMEEEIEKITHRLILSQVGRELKSYPFIKQLAMI